MTAEIVCLADLKGLRTAPPLTSAQREQLQAELRRRVASCDWCTVGVMAPSDSAAWTALTSYGQALGWPPPAVPQAPSPAQGPVFLKGHQRSGQVWLREETGLGEGVLVSGHSDSDPAVEDTWGPLPLDLFADLPCGDTGTGTTGL